ncbi:MAG: hypothetical protein V2I43_11315, partial [Parvularcula sp.]|jgi:hypothetical protein|nr:hypothetical protein [Parvularcula sp.]
LGPNRTIRGDSSETWIDPVIAFRLGVPIGGNWHLGGYVDVGGFGMASESTWQLMGSVRYELSDRWTLAAGWRHYEVDYRKDDGFIYDVGMTGPIIGATIRF